MFDIDLKYESPISSKKVSEDTLKNMNLEYMKNSVYGWPTKKTQTKKVSTGNKAISAGVDVATDYLSGVASDSIFGNSDELGRSLGTLFSSGISSAGNTLSNNLLKGQALTEGLGQNVGASLAGAGAGIAANYIGQGINSLGGDSMLSRGIGQGVATGLGTIGGTTLSNLARFGSIVGKADKLFGTMDTATKAAKVAKLMKEGKTASEASKLAGKAGAINPYGLAATVVGSALGAATGPSKEYGGRHGNITRTMDTIYDIASVAVNAIPGFGQLASGLMVLNKGLSNVFGSTSGMTTQDAILGSAFMPAPVKWLNMMGAKTTDSFDNQSWQNYEKTTSFMGDAFGNLNDRFDDAREEAGKTYGTFSRSAYNKAQDNIDFANIAWNKILNMSDQNRIQNIRSQYMSSINNQRYGQQIQGGWTPLARGKYGMKILNNATNHNMGMRLLSAAALIDNKAMILCNAHD